MGALTVQNIVDAGTKPNFGLNTPSASDTVAIGNGHNTFLVYKNTGGSPITVTVVAPGNTTYGQALPDPAISVAASTGEVWIPIRKEYDDGTGNCTVTTNSQTGLTVAAVTAAW